MSSWVSLVSKETLRRLSADLGSTWWAEWWLPRDACVLITRTYEYGVFHGKAELRLHLELGCWSADLENGRLSWIIWVGPLSSGGSLKLELRGKEQCQSDAIWERLVQPLLCLKVGGATSQGAQAACGGWQRQGDGFSPRASRGRLLPYRCLDLARWGLLRTSELQNCEINIRLFSLWHLGWL